MAGGAGTLNFELGPIPSSDKIAVGGTNNTTGFTALPTVVNTGGVLSVTWPNGSGDSGTYGLAPTGQFVVETSTTLSGPWATETLGGGNDAVEGCERHPVSHRQGKQIEMGHLSWPDSCQRMEGRRIVNAQCVAHEPVTVHPTDCAQSLQSQRG